MVMKDIYNDGSYLKNNPDWHLNDSEWKACQLADLISDNFVKLLPKHIIEIVDIGCGAGGILKYFEDDIKRRGIQVTCVGYDISKQAVKLANQTFPELDIRCCDFFSIDNDKRYDIALVVDMLEHLPDPTDFLLKLQQRTHWILFHIPLDENAWGKIRWGKHYYQYLIESRGHIHYYTKKSALDMLVRTGIKILAWKYTPWGIELKGDDKGRSAPFIRTLRRIGYSTFRNLSVRILGGSSLAVLGSTELV